MGSQQTLEERAKKQRELRMWGGGVYFALQGLGAAFWWFCMFQFPSIRQHFRTSRLSESGLMDFAWPDIPLFVGLSWVCAWALWKIPHSAWTQRLVWLLLGCVWYPTLYVVGSTFWTGGQGWAATMAMLSAAAGSCLTAWTVRPEGALFAVAPERSAKMHMFRTFLQTCVFWGISLVLAPWLVMKAEAALGIVRFQTPMQSWLPWVLFVVVGVLNVGTGQVMSRWGQGTPLPLETAKLLVIRGPYRVVRNPMALTGIFLGLMVGWAMGSWFVLVMSWMGGVFWHVFVRPIEEDDLFERFGEPYQAYRKKVRCWIPVWPPYSPTP
ncbi:MAG: isoprenylcysteine carboxylmethyltransferase family protein [Myxococcales bacterium]|nr:isoprenylcysteine carboxylmethyltransferase family protein [Myxococcales bacterium]